MPLSEEVRRELAAIEPRRDCDRLAELSGLFHTAGSLHLLRPRRVLRPPRPRRGGGRAPRVRAAARLRRRGRDPYVPPPCVRPGDPVPAPRPRGRARAERAAPTRASSRLRTRRWRRRRSGWSGARAAAMRTSAAPFSAAARSAGPARPHLEIRSASRAGADLLAAVAAAEDVVLRVHDRGRLHAPCTPRARRRSPTPWRWPAPGTRPRARRARGRRRRHGPGRTGSRTPTTRTSSARAEPLTARSRRSASSRPRGGSHG